METFRIPKGTGWPAPEENLILDEIRRQRARHKVKVVVQMDRADRSQQQCAALWAVAYPAIGNHCGYRPDDYEFVHREFCKLYFGKKSTPMGDQPKRTTTTNEAGERDVINTLDFARFYEFVQQVAAEKLRVHVPDPDKNWRQRVADEQMEAVQ